MLHMAFLENSVFIPIHGLSSALLLYAWFIRVALHVLLPSALLSLADTCKQISTVLWQAKDGGKKVVSLCAMEMMTETAINDCSLHAQAGNWVSE